MNFNYFVVFVFARLFAPFTQFDHLFVWDVREIENWLLQPGMEWQH
jgi:hypothetical protein